MTQPLTAESLRLAIVQLARNPIISAGNRDEAFRLITQTVSSVLRIERSSIWLYNKHRDRIVCHDLYQQKEGVHHTGLVLTYADFPAYFQALDEERIINAKDAITDPRTHEFAKTYLKPLQIASMLDAPIRLGGVVVGVICQEATKTQRAWSQEEEEFAASIGDLIALAIDLSERKQTEQALRESEDLFRSVTFTATDAIICTSPMGQITIWNRAASTIFGFDMSEVIGRTLAETGIFDEGLHSVRAAINGIVTGSGQHMETNVIELQGTRKDKTNVALELSVAQFHHPQGGQHSTYIVRDITLRKEVEREREAVAQRTQQAQKLESLGVLAGGIAHDFNNLLGAALGRLELHRTSLEPTHEKTHLDVIETTMKRAADLCNQLLAYSGRGAFTDEILCLNTIFLETAGLIEMSISKKASISHTLKDRLPSLRGDPTQIQQVIMNLLTNASDALEDQEGHIKVQTGVKKYTKSEMSSASYVNGEAGLYLYIEVSDTGCGMDKTVRDRLFEPFFTTKFTGRGLGLAATLGIVGRYQGTIFVDSQPGHGTTIRILFPVTEAAYPFTPQEQWLPDTVDSDPTRKLDTRTAPVNILVVDDEEAVRSTFALILQQAGFTVVTSSNGMEALSLFSAQPEAFHCVLLDLVMPKMDGQETLRELRKIREDIPIVLISGYSAQEIGMRFIDEHPPEVLQKPFPMKRLIDTIHRSLKP